MSKMYVVSLAVGLLVGLIYGFLNVRSPAPPVIALVGLLGILLGEQLPPLLRQKSPSLSMICLVVWRTLKMHRKVVVEPARQQGRARTRRRVRREQISLTMAARLRPQSKAGSMMLPRMQAKPVLCG